MKKSANEDLLSFIKFVQSLSESEKMGVLAITEGLRIMTDKQKSGINR